MIWWLIKYLNDAAAKSHALEHLVEAQGDHQRLDGARAFGRPKGDADDHRVNHNAKLKNLQNQLTLLLVFKKLLLFLDGK